MGESARGVTTVELIHQHQRSTNSINATEKKNAKR
jgi:hypothetical protein